MENFKILIIKDGVQIKHIDGSETLLNKELLVGAINQINYLNIPEVTIFFRLFEKKYGNINKISIEERNIYFKELIGKDIKEIDINVFNDGIPLNIEYKKVSIRGKTVQGYFIKKKVEGKGYFEIT